MRGETHNLRGAKHLVDEGTNLEKQQEQLLMNKLAQSGRLPAKPQTSFLQKKLHHQRKFFDSGDYAMNKNNAKNANLPSAIPEMNSQGSKISPVLERNDMILNIDVPVLPDESLQIPRPDTVPQRKSSIIYPSAHSKLSPQPLIHHASHDDPLMDS